MPQTHAWDVDRVAIHGEFGGKPCRVFPAKCMRPGCVATRFFPADPEHMNNRVKNDHKAITPPCVVATNGGGERYIPPVINKEGPIIMEASKMRERKKYYNDNKSAILADVAAMDLREALKKWGIPYTTWITSLSRRWTEAPGHAEAIAKRPVRREKPAQPAQTRTNPERPSKATLVQPTNTVMMTPKGLLFTLAATCFMLAADALGPERKA